MKIADELAIGMGSTLKVSQDPVVDEKQWDAIKVTSAFEPMRGLIMIMLMFGMVTIMTKMTKK